MGKSSGNSKKSKWLFHALLFSGALNVALLVTFAYQSQTPSFSQSQVPSVSKKIQSSSKGIYDLVEEYQTLSFNKLTEKLNQHGHVEMGICKRDLALSFLVSKHHLNLDRSLGGAGVQKRKLSLAKGQEDIEVIVGLSKEQFDQIHSYIEKEKWPFSEKGLFLALQSQKSPFDPSLVDAFALTAHYHFIHLLFARTGVGLGKEHLLKLLSQGHWELIDQVAADLRVLPQFTIEKRRNFLLALAGGGSSMAAQILSRVEPEYCLRALEDEALMGLLDALGENGPSDFFLAILSFPRSDVIWERAAHLLYAQVKESPPVENLLAEAKRRFVPEESRQNSLPKVPCHIVVAGDSLWKIARRYETSIEALRKANDLQSDRLQVGQKLLLPL